MVDGKILPRTVANKLNIPLIEVWEMVDKFNVGRREINKKEISLIEEADCESFKLIKKKMFPEKRPESISGRVVVVSGPITYQTYTTNGRCVNGKKNIAKNEIDEEGDILATA